MTGATERIWNIRSSSTNGQREGCLASGPPTSTVTSFSGTAGSHYRLCLSRTLSKNEHPQTRQKFLCSFGRFRVGKNAIFDRRKTNRHVGSLAKTLFGSCDRCSLFCQAFSEMSIIHGQSPSKLQLVEGYYSPRRSFNCAIKMSDSLVDFSALHIPPTEIHFTHRYHLTFSAVRKSVDQAHLK